jgi:hypothetical protein
MGALTFVFPWIRGVRTRITGASGDRLDSLGVEKHLRSQERVGEGRDRADTKPTPYRRPRSNAARREDERA